MDNTQIKFNLTNTNDFYTIEEGIVDNFWIENNSATIISASINKNIVTLKLSESVSNNSKLSYLGDIPSDMPFIINQNGIGMLSFKGVEISNFNKTNFTKVIVDNWSYYYDNNNLEDPIFAIEHFPAGIGANSKNFNLDQMYVIDNLDIIRSVDLDKKEGTFNLSKYWNFHINDNLPNGWINIRFFYSEILEDELFFNAQNFALENTADFISDFLYIKSNEFFNPIGQIHPNGYTFAIKKAGDSFNYGSYNNRNYLQMNKVLIENNYAGGTVIIKINSIFDTITYKPGMIRFNFSIKKFQGFDGIQWVNFN